MFPPPLSLSRGLIRPDQVQFVNPFSLSACRIDGETKIRASPERAGAFTRPTHCEAFVRLLENSQNVNYRVEKDKD